LGLSFYSLPFVRLKVQMDAGRAKKSYPPLEIAKVSLQASIEICGQINLRGGSQSLSLRRRSPPLFPFGDVIIVADATLELNETRAHIHLRFKLCGGEIDGSVFTKPLLLKCLEAFDKREWRYIEIVEEFVTKLFTITRNYKTQNHKSHVYFDL
jgi:hypothetical protein